MHGVILGCLRCNPELLQFLEAFGEVLGKNLTLEQLTHLFMKIDANSDGSVDWDEFTNFMLLTNQAAMERGEDQTVSPPQTGFYHSCPLPTCLPFSAAPGSSLAPPYSLLLLLTCDLIIPLRTFCLMLSSLPLRSRTSQTATQDMCITQTW